MQWRGQSFRSFESNKSYEFGVQSSEFQNLCSELRTKHSELIVMKLTHQEFEALVVLALKRLPRFFKKKMKNVDVVVEDLASRDLLSGMGLHSPSQLLGLYQGIPLDRRGFYYGNVLPDKITLFQIPIESICRTKEEIEEKVRDVVIHEVGHYFGLNDEKLRELERGDA